MSCCVANPVTTRTYLSIGKFTKQHSFTKIYETVREIEGVLVYSVENPQVKIILV